MNIEAIKEISELLTDESMLQFKGGTTVKGAVEVSTVIMHCCEQYNEGYLESRNITIAAFAGAMILGGAIGLSSVMLGRKLIKKLNSKKETQES